jgi:hypothetical protein
VAWLAVAALCACTGNTPTSVADRFVGRYYVEFNHSGARELAADRAAARLDREIDLLIEARRVEGGAVPPQPRVEFERVGEPVPKGEGVRLTYKLTIRVPVGPPMTKHVVLDLQKVGDAWKVVSFVEAG